MKQRQPYTTRKKIKPVYLALVGFFFSIITHSQVNQIFSQPRANHIFLIATAFERFTDSLSLKKFTDSLVTETTRQKEEKEKWYTELLFTNMLSYLGENGLNRPDLLMQKENYFTNSPYPDIEACFYFFAGQAYNRLKDFEKAFHYYFLAADKIEKTGYENVPLLPRMATDMAAFYAQFEDYTSAVKYSQIALQYNNVLLYTSDIYTRNNLGFYLLKMKKYDEADREFRKVTEQSIARNIPAYIGIGSGNSGNILRIKGKYKEALPYLYADIQINEMAVPENTATSCLYLADCLLHLDSADKALEYINKAKPLAAKSYYQSSYYPMYYHTNALYYKKTGNYAMAAIMQDSLLNLNDSLKHLYDNKILLATTLKEKEIDFLANEAILKTKARNTIATRNIIIGALLLLFGSLFFALRQKAKKEKLLAQQKEMEASQSMQLANQKLEHFLIQINEKNDIIEKFRAQLDDINKTTETNTTNDYNLLQTVILTEEDWNNFKQLFNQARPGFLAKLAIDYPNLSPAEIRLVVLQQLPVSTKHQAAMLGISAASLRTSKYRLRKKYPELLADDDSKEE
jgi:hypothetical protein